MAAGDRSNRDMALALALARGDTIADAARACGVSESTVSRRKKTPEFVALVEQIREGMTDQVVGVLAAGGAEAARKLISLTSSADERVALEAAKAVVDRLFKGREHLSLAGAVQQAIDQLKLAGVLK